MALTSDADIHRARPSHRTIWLVGVVTAAAVAAVNTAVFLLSLAAGAQFVLPESIAASVGGDAIPVAAVVGSSVFGVLLATLGRWIMVRSTRLPEKVFTYGVLALALLSCLQPLLALPDSNPLAVATLCVLHLVVGVGVLVGHRRTRA